MAGLYGKGTITELVKGKKYRIALSAGKNPLSGREYAPSGKVPANAYALNRDGKQVRPRITWKDATDEQKAEFGRWKAPIGYLRHQETFIGTKRQAELRVEAIRREMELLRDCLELGVDVDELAPYGLAIDKAAAMGMSAPQVCDKLKRLKDEESNQVPFSDLVEKYLSIREESGKYRPKTLKSDRSTSKHLLRGLGSTLVVDITPAMIDELYSSMRRSGVGDTTVKKVHKMLKRVLAYAVNNDVIIRNPAERVEAPKKPKPQRHALSTADAQRLSEVCSSGTPTANRVAVFLGLSLGARLGEVLGLTWGNISLSEPRPFARIIQQWTAQNETAPLKTDKDDSPLGRIVPLDAPTVSVLKSWKAEQVKLLNELGIEQGIDTPVVTNKLGAFTSHSRFQRWWRGFCVANNFGRWIDGDGQQIITLSLGDDASLYPGCTIEWKDADGWPCDEKGKRYSRSYKRPNTERHYDGLKFHELRHTHFTMQLAAGIDIPTAQALGGWSTADVLLNVYAHPVSQNIWNSVGFMDRLAAEQAS